MGHLLHGWVLTVGCVIVVWVQCPVLEAVEDSLSDAMALLSAAMSKLKDIEKLAVEQEDPQDLIKTTLL